MRFIGRKQNVPDLLAQEQDCIEETAKCGSHLVPLLLMRLFPIWKVRLDTLPADVSISEQKQSRNMSWIKTVSVTKGISHV